MNKIAAERNQRALLELAIQPGNDACADCKTRNPRWASHNLGIFICMNCASIHRKMGTHISKVKSLTMDTWTKEQVEHMRNNGNVKSNAYYNPHETRHPPPTNMVDSERDSDLEKFIRSKYEFKSFISRGAVAVALLGPPKSINRVSPSPTGRSQTAPVPTSSMSAPPPVPPKTPVVEPSTATTIPASAPTLSPTQFRSVSQPVSSPPTSYTPSTSLVSGVQVSTRPATQESLTWSTLASLRSPASTIQPSFTQPLALHIPSQPQPLHIHSQPQASPMATSPFAASPQSNPYSGLSASPSSPFPSSMANVSAGGAQGGIPRSTSLNTGLALNANANSPFSTNSMSGGSSPFQTTGTLPPFQPSISSLQPHSTSALSFQTQSIGASSYQGQSNLGLGLSSISANPFAGMTASAVGSATFSGQSMSFQPQSSPYLQTSQLQPQPLPQPSPFQRQLPQQPSPFPQTTLGTNPFYQGHAPVSATQPQFASSPFGQPMQQPVYTAGNPFAGLQNQQHQPAGFAGQQWTGM